MTTDDQDVNMTDAPVPAPAAAAGTTFGSLNTADMPLCRRPLAVPTSPGRPGEDSTFFSVHGFTRRLRHYSD